MILPEANPGLFGIVFADFPSSTDPNVLHTRQTPFTHGGRNILVGKDFYGRAHLMIPVTSIANVGSIQNLSQGIRVRELDQLGDKSVLTGGYLDLECTVIGTDDVFGAICNDICREIDTSSLGLDSVMLKLEETIQKWREVLKSLATREPSESAKIGLMGELVVLRALFAIQGPSAIDAWVGQDRSRHDFEFEAKAVEVKSSLNLSAKRAHIHGAKQLEAAPGTSLDLLLIQFEKAQKGITVADLVSELLVSGSSLEKLEGRLAEYLPSGFLDMPDWAKNFALKIEEVSSFRVDHNFPRIKVKDLDTDIRERITGLEYVLDLDGLVHVNLEFDDLEKFGLALL